MWQLIHNHPNILMEHWIETIVLLQHLEDVGAYTQLLNFVEVCQRKNEKIKSHFLERNLKKKA